MNIDRRVTILVDQDNTIADFERGFLKEWKRKHPHHPFIPLNKRNTFLLSDQYPEDLYNDVASVYLESRFFANLQPIKGAVEALYDMDAKGHLVRIVTSPLIENEHCIAEKYEWVHKYLGHAWERKVIVAKDKTFIHGEILIDDNHNVTGDMVPSWEHIIFERSHNVHIEGRRLKSWNKWQDVIK